MNAAGRQGKNIEKRTMSSLMNIAIAATSSDKPEDPRDQAALSEPSFLLILHIAGSSDVSAGIFR